MLRAAADCYGWTHIAIPALGCGLGGLDWREVRLLLAAFEDWGGVLELPDAETVTR